mmetsp:Transcript_1516/g.4601  ORF Transcript_1516/g.4601 Transcript_1516/m.4601 type:complete len:208 (-) Transcript_1516:304-927(-)
MIFDLLFARIRTGACGTIVTRTWLPPSPSPCLVPTTSGDPRRQATSSLGNFLDRKTMAKAPSSCCITAIVRCGKFKLGFSVTSWSYRNLVSFATVSVSVCEVKVTPWEASMSLSTLWFVMMPLCTTRKSMSGSDACGWLFSRDGCPCVAHLVCAMPTWHESILSFLSLASVLIISATLFSSFSIVPTSRKTIGSSGPSPSHASPALS